jgi:hypothetical protein
MRRPSARGGDAEGKAGEQQEQAGRQSALELPDVVPRPGAIRGRQQRIHRVSVQHEHDGQRAREIDEDDALPVDTGSRAGGPTRARYFGKRSLRQTAITPQGARRRCDTAPRRYLRCSYSCCGPLLQR